VDEEVQVRILDVDSEKRRISLSIREALPDRQEKTEPDFPEEIVQEEQEEMTVNLGEFFPDELKNI